MVISGRLSPYRSTRAQTQVQTNLEHTHVSSSMACVPDIRSKFRCRYSKMQSANRISLMACMPETKVGQGLGAGTEKCRAQTGIQVDDLCA